MYIRGLMPRNFAELVEAIPIGHFYVINVFHRGPSGPPSRGWGESVSVFLREPVATYDFPGGPDPPVPTSGSVHAIFLSLLQVNRRLPLPNVALQ